MTFAQRLAAAVAEEPGQTTTELAELLRCRTSQIHITGAKIGLQKRSARVPGAKGPPRAHWFPADAERVAEARPAPSAASEREQLATIARYLDVLQVPPLGSVAERVAFALGRAS